MSAKIVHKSYNQNDSLLFPPSLGELIPENHPVRTVSAIIDRLDISGIESTYKGGGTSSFHPRMLLKVIVCSYMCNVYSGRRMESLLHENVNYMWLSGMSSPDFLTINRFRSERLCDGRFEELFPQTVVLVNGEGLVSLKVQYIDGTKIESAANKYTFVWKGSVEKNKARLEAKVDAVLKTAESVLAGEDAECTKEEPCVEGLPKRTGRILRKMDGQGISDRKLRRSVKK
ncbi:transposase [uncultured Bacteroides sp.]|uniref:transposase n=1 Tax=uncultured Bacteroides sp. TaxID=162156 RepID=UPI00262BE11E|nr:transposase [uncultured Bacteroides sp.]